MAVIGFVARSLTSLHAKIVRTTGWLGGGTKDGSVLVLRHTGARSGKVRETPLGFIGHDGGYVVCASDGGASQPPGWYFNLKANPEATITVAKATIPVRARELDGEERSRAWATLSGLHKRWEQYQSKTERILPLMALDPQ